MAFEFNSLIPELSVSDLKKSKKFYTDDLGFSVCYQRENDGFIFLQKERAQIMLEQKEHSWKVGELMPPYGRGINFQIIVADVVALYESLKKKEKVFFKELTTNTYTTSEGEESQTEFLIQDDPDGYLLRFCS